MSGKSLVVRNPDPNEDADWREIVDGIIANLDTDEIPDNVVQALEYLLSGFSVHETAKRMGKSTPTVRRWISKYPAMALVLANKRPALLKWRMAKMDQQFLLALDRSREVLEVSLARTRDDEPGIDPKILGLVAQHSRFILDKVLGNRLDISVTHELGENTMSATRDALDYLAGRLSNQRDTGEEIVTTFRVVDPKFENGPILDENGNPKYGELGKLDTDAAGTLCHICGSRTKHLRNHISRLHNLETKEYELAFMLLDGAINDLERKQKGSDVNDSSGL